MRIPPKVLHNPSILLQQRNVMQVPQSWMGDPRLDCDCYHQRLVDSYLLNFLHLVRTQNLSLNPLMDHLIALFVLRKVAIEEHLHGRTLKIKKKYIRMMRFFLNLFYINRELPCIS